MPNMKRRKLEDIHNDAKQRFAHLLQVATQLNNLGASLYDICDYSAALDTSREAISALLEATSLQFPDGAVGSESTSNIHVSMDDNNEHFGHGARSAMIRNATAKLRAFTESSTRDDSNEPSMVDIDQTSIFLFEPLKIDVTSDGKIFFEPGKVDVVGDVNGKGSNSSNCEVGALVAIMLHNISVLYAKLKRWDLAEQILENVLHLCSDNESEDYPYGWLVFPVVLNNLGHIYQSRGESEAALMAFSRALCLAQEVFDLHGFQGNVHWGRIESLCCECEKRILKYFATIMFNMGSLHHSMEEDDDAAHYLVDSLSHTHSPSLLLRIVVKLSHVACSYQQKDMYNEAMQVYNAALDARGRITRSGEKLASRVYSEILFRVGLIHIQNGRANIARKAFSVSLLLVVAALGIENIFVEQLRNRIKHVVRSFVASPAA